MTAPDLESKQPPVLSDSKQRTLADGQPPARVLRTGVSGPMAVVGGVDSILLEYLKTARQAGGVSGPNSWSPTAPPKIHPALRQTHAETSDDDRETGDWDLPDSFHGPSCDVRDRGVLLRIDRDGRGEVVSLPQEGAIFGRSSRAGVVVRDEAVSRQHAKLSFSHGVYVVEDLGSRNGTYVDGNRVELAVLTDGALLQVGPRATYRFALMGSAEEDSILKLYDGAMMDPLTGIYNRRHFDRRFESELAFARRHHTELSLVLFDIDHFKQINDRLGHAAGDAVLRRVAQVFKSQLRTEDLVARYGGEEFVVLLRDERIDGAKALADRIRRRISEEEIEVPPIGSVRVTISAGCASLRTLDRGSDRGLLEVADGRLYRAKSSGRNRACATD